MLVVTVGWSAGPGIGLDEVDALWIFGDAMRGGGEALDGGAGT